MALKTLKEHNDACMAAHEAERERQKRGEPTGIACPKCGDELVRPDPHVVLPSCPPQMNTNCPACSYQGYALLG